MGFDFNPLLYFICRSCGQTFSDVDELKTHKIKCHLGECLQTKCIIFEEIILADEWVPPKVCTIRSRSRHLTNKLIARNASNETITLKTNLEKIREPTFPFRNPYVSLRQLTPEELKSTTISTEFRTGVGCSATRKRSVVLAEAASAQMSSNLAPSVIEPRTEKNTAVALLPKRTKFCEDFDWTAGAVNKKPNETRIQSTMTEMETNVKLEPKSEVDPEVQPKIESKMCSSFSEDQNDFTEDFLGDDPTNYEPQTSADNCAPEGFNDSNSFIEDDRPSTPDFTLLAEENAVILLPVKDPQGQAQISPVICIMCETQLVTAGEEKNHLDNCWLHNKSRHIYCVLCNIRFNYPLQLKKHQQEIHNMATDKVHVVNMKDFDGEDDVDEISDMDDLIPLGKWIQKRREKYPDLILLHPDPTDPKQCLLSKNTKLTTCKLCKTELQLDLVKAHVKTCWVYNKERHVHCNLCESSFKWPGQLRSHNSVFHPFKSLALPAIFCLFCHEEFPSFPHLREHEASMKEFFQTMTAKESLRKKKAPHNKTGEDRRQPSSAASKLGQIEDANPGPLNHNYGQNNNPKYPDALKDGILLGRSPSDKLRNVILDSPETCKLCLHVLKSEHQLKLHLENCSLHNKARHVYCISCKTYFKHPRALQFHNLREHSEAQSEIDTDLTTVDEAESNSSVDADLLPLGQWIEMRRRDYGDVIHLDPDPTLNCQKKIVINRHKPIRCKLCKFASTSTETMKGHAATCWFFNKLRHRRCVPCQILYTSSAYLQQHNRNHHLEIFPRPSFYCWECKQVFRTFEEFKPHEKSREEFFKDVRKSMT